MRGHGVSISPESPKKFNRPCHFLVYGWIDLEWQRYLPKSKNMTAKLTFTAEMKNISWSRSNCPKKDQKRGFLVVFFFIFRTKMTFLVWKKRFFSGWLFSSLSLSFWIENLWKASLSPSKNISSLSTDHPTPRPCVLEFCLQNITNEMTHHANKF